MFIELDELEKELLKETDIVVASSRKDLVETIYDEDDVECYKEDITNKEMTFVDWFINDQDCYLERDGYYYTTFCNGYHQSTMVSIIDKVNNYIKTNGNTEGFENVIERLKDEIYKE